VRQNISPPGYDMAHDRPATKRHRAALEQAIALVGEARHSYES